MRRSLKEQLALADERYWEILNENAEVGLWEEGMHEFGMWDPHEERVVLDKRMWTTIG